MSDQWRRIAEFPSYEVHYTGRVRNRKRQTDVKVYENAGGYKYVSLYKDGKHYSRSPKDLRKQAFGY